MLKVKLVPMTLMVPVIDNSGDHDCKMEDSLYYEVRGAIEKLSMIEKGNPMLRPSSEVVRQGVSQNAHIPLTEDAYKRACISYRDAELQDAKAWEGAKIEVRGPPVSQIDPPIDTTVRDSEMRSSAPEMSLDEFRERPERTKAPPRPRANSWRHE